MVGVGSAVTTTKSAAVVAARAAAMSANFMIVFVAIYTELCRRTIDSRRRRSESDERKGLFSNVGGIQCRKKEQNDKQRTLALYLDIAQFCHSHSSSHYLRLTDRIGE